MYLSVCDEYLLSTLDKLGKGMMADWNRGQNFMIDLMNRMKRKGCSKENACQCHTEVTSGGSYQSKSVGVAMDSRTLRKAERWMKRGKQVWEKKRWNELGRKD